MLKTLGIGELAKETGCKVQTIRFYEQIGLLPSPPRTSGNQRRYDADNVKRLRFIRHARDMGFDIGDIRELIALVQNPLDKCDAANEIALHHLEMVRERIQRLKRLEKELARIADCPKNKTVAECRVIEILADHGKCKSKKH